jgi:hypothetical protein
MNETYPSERVAKGHDRMMSGKARFRVVLTIAECLWGGDVGYLSDSGHVVNTCLSPTRSGSM